jgi:hypothetical protein
MEEPLIKLPHTAKGFSALILYNWGATDHNYRR